MRVGKMLVAAAAVGALSTAANAALTVSWSPVVITAFTDSFTPAPGILGYQSWDLNIHLDPGDDFQSARILFDPTGPIFIHSGFVNPGPASPPNPASFGFAPVVEFTSYLQGPSQTPPPGTALNIVGSTDGVVDLPPPAILTTDKFAVAFGDLVTQTQGGDFTLARFTFGGTPVQAGTNLGTVFSANNQVGIPIPANPAFLGGGPVTTPEPASLGLLALAGVLGLRRRA